MTLLGLHLEAVALLGLFGLWFVAVTLDCLVAEVANWLDMGYS